MSFSSWASLWRVRSRTVTKWTAFWLTAFGPFHDLLSFLLVISVLRQVTLVVFAFVFVLIVDRVDYFVSHKV